MIYVPAVVTSLYRDIAFVPLNSTEIGIFGGKNVHLRAFGDVIIFNTTTCNFKKEINDKANTLVCVRN